MANIVDPGKKREAIYAVIDKHAPKVAPKLTPDLDTKSYWRKKYEDEHALRMKEKAEYEKQIVKLEAQIEKQKAPVKAFLAMKEAVMPMM